MRKRIFSLFSLAVLLSLCISNICVSADAQEAVSIESLTVSECAEDDSLITVNAAFTASAGVDYLTFLLTAGTAESSVSEDNILYIKQIENSADTYQFNIEKSKLKEILGTDDLSQVTLCLKIGGTSVSEASVKEFPSSTASSEDVSLVESAKSSITSLADGSAEVSALITESSGEIDAFFEDNILSDEERGKINSLIKGMKKRCGMLNIRFQITAGTTASSDSADIRFISTVDSLNYKETGFYITIDGVKKRISTRYVYTGLIGKNGETATNYTPGNMFAESKWFSTYSVWNIPNSAFDTQITVQPFVVTKDGTEIVGVEKTRTVSNFIK